MKQTKWSSTTVMGRSAALAIVQARYARSLRTGSSVPSFRMWSSRCSRVSMVALNFFLFLIRLPTTSVACLRQSNGEWLMLELIDVEEQLLSWRTATKERKTLSVFHSFNLNEDMLASLSDCWTNHSSRGLHLSPNDSWDWLQPPPPHNPYRINSIDNSWIDGCTRTFYFTLKKTSTCVIAAIDCSCSLRVHWPCSGF